MSRWRWTAAALTLTLAALYWDVFVRMAALWWTHEYAGHGMFVPIFSAIIAWAERDRLRATADRGRPGGLLLVLLGATVLVLGRLGRSILVEGLSVAVVIAGLVLLAFGAGTLRAAAFPIGFLVLMVPLPQQAVEAVTLSLQLFAASAAGLVLSLFGIPFLRDGVTLELAGATLAVAEACNGLRFLLGLFVVTVAYAYVTQVGVWRKVVLSAAAVPVAILANAARVASIAVAAQYAGPEVALGTGHLWIGKVVWLGTIGGLLALGLAMRQTGAKLRVPVGAEA
jgi:exosortase